MMEVSMKNLLLQMESNNIRDSCMRFCGERTEGREKECRTGYPEKTGKER